MSTRDRMLDAAAHVMRTKGLAHATTKQIAKEAGFSEAALYKHFRDKTDLFVAVLNERAPNTLANLLGGLTPRVGQAAVPEVLADIARAAIAFYRHNFPMAASVFSEPHLLTAHTRALRERGTGPAHINATLAEYLAAEQKLGRVKASADPRAAAALLIGACFQHAFLGYFADRPDDDEADQRFAASLVDTLAPGLLPEVTARP